MLVLVISELQAKPILMAYSTFELGIIKISSQIQVFKK